MTGFFVFVGTYTCGLDVTQLTIGAFSFFLAAV
jgi:hypothetical protein